MKRTTRKLLHFSGGAMALGLILAAAAFFGGANISGATFGPDGAHVANNTPQTLSREFPEGFRSIDLNIKSGDVQFVPSDRFGVEITNYGDGKFSCSEENGTLKISDTEPQRVVWMSFSFSMQKQNTVKILLPENTSLKKLKFRMSDGEAKLSDFSAESTDIQNRYGNVTISDASCGAASILLSNGTGTLKNLTMDTLTYHNSYGDSSFEDVSVSDPQEATLGAGNGDISISGLTAASLVTEDSYGAIKLSGLKLDRLTCLAKNGNISLSDSTVKTTDLSNFYGEIEATGLGSGGLKANCKNGRISIAGTLKGKNDIHSDYGSIDVKTSLEQDQYTVGLSTAYGSLTVNGKKLSGALLQPGNAENGLNVSGKDGDITVDFGK